MNEAFREAVIAAWLARPDGLRGTPASPDQIAAFEAEFGPIPDDFRWFLANCGGGPCGAEWIDDIVQLTETNRRFRAERAEGYWALMRDVFVIGLDGAGNPYGIHVPTGEVVVEDHTFGGLHTMASSFEELLWGGYRMR